MYNKKVAYYSMSYTVLLYQSWGLHCRAVCITRNFSEPQNPQLIIESGFKSRAGYDGARTVVKVTARAQFYVLIVYL